MKTTYQDVMACDVERFKRFFHMMLDEGVYLAPSAFEAGPARRDRRSGRHRRMLHRGSDDQNHPADDKTRLLTPPVRTKSWRKSSSKTIC